MIHSPAKWRENCCFLKPFSCLTDYFFEFVKSLSRRFIFSSNHHHEKIVASLKPFSNKRCDYAFCQVFPPPRFTDMEQYLKKCSSTMHFCSPLLLTTISTTTVPLLALDLWLHNCKWHTTNAARRILTKNVLLPRVKTSTTGPKSFTVNPLVKASELSDYVKHTLLLAYFEGTVR